MLAPHSSHELGQRQHAPKQQLPNSAKQIKAHSLLGHHRSLRLSHGGQTSGKEDLGYVSIFFGNYGETKCTSYVPSYYTGEPQLEQNLTASYNLLDESWALTATLHAKLSGSAFSSRDSAHPLGALSSQVADPSVPK